MASRASSDPTRTGAFRLLAYQSRWWFWTLAGLLMMVVGSILVEWIGINTVWRDQGVMHTVHMLETELGYLNDSLVRSLPVATDVDLGQIIIGWVSAPFDWIGGKFGYDGNPVPRWLWQYNVPPSDDALVNAGRWALIVWVAIVEHFRAAVMIVQIFLVRLTVVLLSAPLFIVLAYLAIVEGLTERERRKAGGAVVQAGLHHIARWFLQASLLLPIVFYLAWPVATDPVYTIFPCAIAFALFLRLAVATYKPVM